MEPKCRVPLKIENSFSRKLGPTAIGDQRSKNRGQNFIKIFVVSAKIPLYSLNPKVGFSFYQVIVHIKINRCAKIHLSKNVLITEIFAFKSIAYLKADPGQFLTYLTITSILAKVRGNGQAERRSVHVGRARPHHMLQTEEVLDIVEDDPSTSTREIARQVNVSQHKVWKTLRENQLLYPFHNNLTPGPDCTIFKCRSWKMTIDSLISATNGLRVLGNLEFSNGSKFSLLYISIEQRYLKNAFLRAHRARKPHDVYKGTLWKHRNTTPIERELS
ncbi:hypothetical protein NQ317_000080 [Molorchus minor]|uniref:Uncharacterized protein n=1 Tax=Molorchus minor TaxID=1323400 RepID=A0ABQ9JCH4_9CUCU|nr:hypothetical protein NQ317_000080 [Molorchus minor]